MRSRLADDWPMYAAGAFIALVVGFIAWGIYAAVTAPHEGIVHARDYSPAYTSTQCTTVDKTTTCVPVYHGPSWSFDLYARDGNHGWREVSEGDYQRYGVGDYYPG